MAHVKEATRLLSATIISVESQDVPLMDDADYPMEEDEEDPRGGGDGGGDDDDGDGDGGNGGDGGARRSEGQSEGNGNGADAPEGTGQPSQPEGPTQSQQPSQPPPAAGPQQLTVRHSTSPRAAPVALLLPAPPRPLLHAH